MLSLRVSLDDTDAGRNPGAGVRKRTIEDDDSHADAARHVGMASRERVANAMRDSLLLELK